MDDLTDALDSAWAKIQTYCKKNYEGRSTQDVQVRFINGPNRIVEFGVTPGGIPYIAWSDYQRMYVKGKGFDWIYHPDHDTHNDSIRYRLIEEVIHEWEFIKKKLNERFDKLKAIMEFEP